MKILQKEPLRLELSNDAFYCLCFGEDPLDEISIAEAKEVMDMFPAGFIIKDDWEPIGNTGLIAATFIIKSERRDWPEGYLELIGGWLLLYKMLPNDIVMVQKWHETKQSPPPEKILIDYHKGKPWIKWYDCNFPLWGRTKKWAP